MEIKIDTQKDSKEDIKQVINLLKKFVGEDELNTQTNYHENENETYQKKMFEENKTSSEEAHEHLSQGLFNIFDSSETAEEKKDNIGLEIRRKESEEKESEEKKTDKKDINIIPY